MPKAHKSAPSTWPWKTSFFMVGLAFFLCMIGLGFVFEASVAEAYQQFGNQYHFVSKQLIWCGVAVVTFLIGFLTPTNWWRKLSPLIYFASLISLVFVFIPGLGVSVNGAHRWFRIAGFTFQPIELMKFAITCYFSSWLVHHRRIVPFLTLVLIPVFLLILQPDLGSALIMITISFGLYFLAGADLKTFSWLAIAGVILIGLLIIIQPYRLRRLTTFLNPEADPLGSSFQIRQITLALGSGGLFGQGIGKSRQKFSYIPEASSDSIFAIVAEELGFLGAVAIIGLFLIFLNLGYKIYQQQEPGSYNSLLAGGILLWFSVQLFLNLSAVVALIPLTGVPLPFFSYGGSSLIMLLCATGVLARMGKQT